MSYLNQSERDAAVQAYSNWTLEDYIKDAKNVVRSLSASEKAEEAVKKVKKASKKLAKKTKKVEKQEAKAAKKAKNSDGAVAAGGPISKKAVIDALVEGLVSCGELNALEKIGDPAFVEAADRAAKQTGMSFENLARAVIETMTEQTNTANATFQQPGGKTIANDIVNGLPVVESMSTDLIVTTTGENGEEVVIASTMGQTSIEDAVKTAAKANPEVANTALGNALLNPTRAPSKAAVATRQSTRNTGRNNNG